MRPSANLCHCDLRFPLPSGASGAVQPHSQSLEGLRQRRGLSGPRTRPANSLLSPKRQRQISVPGCIFPYLLNIQCKVLYFIFVCSHFIFLIESLLYFFLYHLVPVYSPNNRHSVVHVHESFFLFAGPLYPLFPHTSCHLLSIYESVSAFLSLLTLKASPPPPGFSQTEHLNYCGFCCTPERSGEMFIFVF